MKNKAISNIKIQQILSSLAFNDVGILLRDAQDKSDIGLVNLLPSKGTHWVTYNSENYFDNYGQKLFIFSTKRNGHCLFSECKIQCLTCKRDSYCASFCFYTIDLMKILGTDFKTSVWSIYNQLIQ